MSETDNHPYESEQTPSRANPDTEPPVPTPVPTPADSQLPLSGEEATTEADQTTPERFREIMERFSQSFTSEVRSKIGRLNELVGSNHWLSVGTYKEIVIREQIASYAPTKYKVGTGFIVVEHPNGSKLMSKQIDILIWDSSKYSPIFSAGEFVIIPPEACRAAIEVKGHLDSTSLREGLENLESVSWFAQMAAESEDGWFQTYLIAGEIDEDLKFPNAIFNSLHKTYMQVPFISEDGGKSVRKWSMTTEKRVEWSNSGWSAHHWSTQWITGICVLGKGVVGLGRFSFADEHDVPGYFVVNEATPEADNSFGYFRSMLLFALRHERQTENLYRIRLGPSLEKIKSNEKKPILLLPFSEVRSKKIEQLDSNVKPFPVRRPWTWNEEDALRVFQKKAKNRQEIADIRRKLAEDADGAEDDQENGAP
jgi:hypothetical protein